MPAPSKNRPTNDELRNLYLTQRLSSPRIAALCGVEKITILRWLKDAGIERRPTSNGLANRGITEPTDEELYDMVHVQHLSYEQIAAIYGVDATAVPYWLRKRGIPRPTTWATRRKGITPRLPGEQELRDRMTAGQSMRSIARDFKVSQNSIKRLARKFEIQPRRDGWDSGHRLPCQDGHEARSTYEQRVDDWLTHHGLAHEVEPRYPWDARYRADFRVGQTWIEIWGVTNSPTYTARKQHKIKRCAEEGLDLLGIDHWRFAPSRPHGKRWDGLLQRLLAVESPPQDLFHC